MKNNCLTGIVLAGGKSSRMGSDKSLLVINKKTFIENIIEALKPNVDDIIIIENSGLHFSLGYKIYKDIFTDCGPLGGIYTALTHSKTQKNIILSCDMPLISSDVLKYLIKCTGEEQVTIVTDKGKLEPLCAIYNKTCLPIVESCLKSNNLKLKDVLKQLNIKEIEVSNQTFYSPNLISNINTLSEYKRITNSKW